MAQWPPLNTPLVSYTITESKERRTTVRYTSQGAPCSRHFYSNLKALIIKQNIMYIKGKTEKENKEKIQCEIIKKYLNYTLRLKKKNADTSKFS